MIDRRTMIRNRQCLIENRHSGIAGDVAPLKIVLWYATSRELSHCSRPSTCAFQTKDDLTWAPLKASLQL